MSLRNSAALEIGVGRLVGDTRDGNPGKVKRRRWVGSQDENTALDRAMRREVPKFDAEIHVG